jgi:hypothetical protein
MLTAGTSTLRSHQTDSAYDTPNMSTSRRPTFTNRPTIDPVIPLQPQSGSCPTTDDKRSRPEGTDRDPPETAIPLLDAGGLGPKPGAQ